MATEQAPARTPERQAFYDRIAPADLAPLWENLHRMVTPEPRPSAVPAIWRYHEVRPHLMASGGLITAQEATRRVLMLMNPGLGGEASITGSLFAGLQLIMPGDRAGAPAYAIGAALHHRGERRLYGRRWRAHDDAARRFCDHPILDLARPRQRDQ
jgi:gentisate 1,2-dioxygenase